MFDFILYPNGSQGRVSSQNDQHRIRFFFGVTLLTSLAALLGIELLS